MKSLFEKFPSLLVHRYIIAGSGTGVYVCVCVGKPFKGAEVKSMAAVGIIKVEANKADKDKQRE